MKFLAPWLAFTVSLVAAAFLLKERSRLSEELTVARAAQIELEQLKGQGGADANPSENGGELARLRAENAEVHRLRNEVRTLKAQNPANAKAAAQAALGGQPITMILDDVEQFKLVEENAKLKTELEDLKADKNRVQAESCAQNIFLIQSAINQWALENSKRQGENVLPQNITPYLKGQAFPLCPAGGSYSTRPLGMPPTCSFPGHNFGQ